MKNLVIRDGTSQTMRALPALQDGYFNLDEMPFPDLLAMATEFAALVRFHNQDDQPEGDWAPFFHADETIVMSRILAIDLPDEVARFDDWWRRTPERVGIGEQDWNVHELPVAALVRTINDWYVALLSAQSENGLSLRMLIESVIAQLRVDKSGLPGMLHNHAGAIALHPIWSSAVQEQAGAVAGVAKAAHAAPAKALVRTAFHALLKAIEMIQKEALARLPASLQSQQHDPAVGLLIAFVQQFQKLKGKLNRFTRNYLDFYYDKMLGATPLPAVADSTSLIFRKNPGTRDMRIPAQTEFMAGLDEDNRDIVYVSDNELVVNDARVSALQTVYFDHNRYSSPENLLDDDDLILDATVADRAVPARTWPTSAWFNQMPPQSDVVAAAQAFPIFGAPKNTGVQVASEDARIGFALSSKVLLLKEGLRKISVTLLFEDDTLARRLDSLAAAMRDGADSDHDSELEAIRRQDIFLKVFRRIFRIGVTGEHGWLDVPDYVPAQEGRTLVLSFELPPQAQAVVAYNAQLHGEQYVASAPMIRFIVNPGAYLYPYGMLRGLPISGARIDVQVSGCRDLVLHNNIGQLSATAPFAPFGPLPKIGSYLVVGSTEMAGKQILEFSVDVEWADLPKISGGFATYYREYGVEVANDDFLATVAVLGKGTWMPVGEQNRQTVRLFRTEVRPGQGESIDSRMVWNCNRVTHLFEPDDGVSVSKPLTYGPAAKNGFFKFTLAAPGFAFGHEQYPHVLSSTLVQNARIKRLRRQREVPRSPYTPQINSISVSYRAASTVRIDRKVFAGPGADDQFMHLYPSGWKTLGVTSYPGASLLPCFGFSGNLYIGIDAAQLRGTLTLFFQLREDSLPLTETPPARAKADVGLDAGLNWFYLAGNEWKLLPRSRVLSDGTQQFMTSGIVTLSLPADISADNSVMPGGSYWLRVSADRDLEKYCSLYGVYAQAVTVRRHPDVSARVPIVLPAASITRSRKPLPGITGVLQPIASGGGRAAETRAQLHSRLSERLRHKNRAISAADYEALILQYFPEVYKVKCFANVAIDRGPDDCVRPGHVLVVPLPYWPAGKHLDQMPMLNGNLMREIRAFLQGLASPWSRIAVENPVYEQIQVHCKVRFTGGLNSGYYINELNRAISRFLTPWDDGRGYRTHFGWHIRQHDIEAFIGELPYVESVSGFSMLRIASADAATYALFDTAGGGKPTTDITPLYPWSIAIPTYRHAIEAVDDTFVHGAIRTALGRLEIGSTFIISEDENDHQDNGAA
ncbi:baseplate J/gp47 family protein [Herbaspirillum sp. CF444]|uniref:baseplate J/gp47 family protein n=1 Tax=Herbaspirillum sp. CF444 TaxID=1144319 RepID=UPI0009D99790|nr:baseplate J/gp47 family protein [Herbaspirillum sp. CF444]